MAKTNSEDSENTFTHRVTYQPFLLALGFGSLLVKVAISLYNNRPVVDIVFVILVIFFVGSVGVYLWEKTHIKNSKHQVTIRTKDLNRVRLTGIKTRGEGTGNKIIEITTQDVTDGDIVGLDDE